MGAGTCIHFNGRQNDRCALGLSYEQFHDEQGRGLPCIKFIEKSARGGTYLKPGERPAEVRPMPGLQFAKPCASFQEPTPEQVQAERNESEAALEKALAGIRIAASWRVKPKPSADRREVINCPVCGGNLHLSQSSLNGHVHGRCETDGCIHWME